MSANAIIIINEYNTYIDNRLSTIVKDIDQDVSTNLNMIRHILNYHVTLALLDRSISSVVLYPFG